jgi:acetyl esterase/lipase
MHKHCDISYSRIDPDIRQIDVFLPDDHGNGAAIFFVHGGGWSGGNRRQWHAVMEHFCGLGYVCGSTSYHLLPDHHFPLPFEDVRLALSWFKARAGEFGFEPSRIATWGSSAGGHLAALLAVIDPADELGMSAEIADRDTRVGAAVCYCTIFSTHREGGYYVPAFFGGKEEEEAPALYRQASPIDHVSGGEPPFVMITGDADQTTPIAWHEAMKAKLEAHGGSAEIHILPGVDHGYGYGMTTDAQKAAAAHAAAFLARVL